MTTWPSVQSAGSGMASTANVVGFKPTQESFVFSLKCYFYCLRAILSQCYHCNSSDKLLFTVYTVLQNKKAEVPSPLHR